MPDSQEQPRNVTVPPAASAVRCEPVRGGGRTVPLGSS